MYAYDDFDQRLIDERVAQFREQTHRYLEGRLTEDEFRPLRLLNGLYEEKHAPMLRVAIPYGVLSSDQLRMLATASRRYDRGYGHFTTRQNIQFNWPKIAEVPDLLADLATVQMHAIQTSGNTVRNISTDHLAGVAADEIDDPRPWCELLRQWSTLHPEFSYLPRKFKIAFTGATSDRAAVAFHDIGFRLVKNSAGDPGFEVLVGGGMGRTPMLGKVIRPFLDRHDLLSYSEAILRVYNLLGRRDNLYKARIKILVESLGVEAFGARVEAEWSRIRDGQLRLNDLDIARVTAHFRAPDYDRRATWDRTFESHIADDREFARWVRGNVADHKVGGYRIVTLSLKPPGGAPGDITAAQMEAVAELADLYSFSEIRTTHSQNLVLADVRKADLYPLWQTLRAFALATPNIGTLTDIICCPGADYCSLANATSIPLAQEINTRFDDIDWLHDLGDIQIKMSGCINACGHHHAGHIGILGVNKKGEEFYQILLGGSADTAASLGRNLGPALRREAVTDAIAALLTVFVEQRLDGESFLACVRRLGLEPFKERVYARH